MAMYYTDPSLQKPTLREVSKHVKSAASEEWHDLGLELEVGESDGELLHQINTRNNYNKRDCFTDMIRIWLKSGSNVTWKRLLECLKELGIQKAVQNIESFLYSTSTSDQQSVSQESSQQSYFRSDQDSNITQQLETLTLGEPTIASQQQTSSVQAHTANPVPTVPVSIDGPDDDDESDEPEQVHLVETPSLDAQPIGCELVRTPRGYQQELAKPGIEGKNYIFVAPTGSGKTMVTEIIIQDHINKMRSQNIRPRVVFMVKTVPLAYQQAESLKQNLRGTTIEFIAGNCVGSIQSAFSENEIVACTSGKLEEELRSGKVHFDLAPEDQNGDKIKLTLIIMDECHNAGKPSLESRVMERYLEFKHSASKLPGGANMPQVVGLTASPGAGDNPNLDPDTTLEHLNRLCAMLDATYGILAVTKNLEELHRHSVMPDYTTVAAFGRDPTESFLVMVRDEMNRIEATTCYFNNCPYPKWSLQYESMAVRTKTPLECTEHSGNRDEISAINVLICCSRALSIYMELQREDALKVMEEFHDLPQDDSHCTPVELKLKQELDQLFRRLRMLPVVENPLLESTKRVITERFEDNPDSRAMIFVRSKRHAYGMCDFLKTIRLTRGTLRPQVITGHTKDQSSLVKTVGMTAAEQSGVLEKIRSGESNVLVATNVAEEGLDIPACNLVIPYQRATTDIGQAQTQGRARAADSEIVSIISKPGLKLREIQNLQKLELVNKIIRDQLLEIKLRSRLSRFKKMLKEKQEEILRDKRSRRRYKARLQSTPREKFIIICKKCKTLACYGVDIYTERQTPGDDEYDPNCHYIVTGEDILTRFDKRVHTRPGDVNRTIYKTHKIHCKKCGSAWGIWCTFKKYNVELPVLKCSCILFKEGSGPPRPVKKWSEAPFAADTLPLEIWVTIQHSREEEAVTDENY